MSNLWKYVRDSLWSLNVGYDPSTPQPDVTATEDHLRHCHERNVNGTADRTTPTVTVAVLFYRCHYLSGNRAFVDAILDELEALNVKLIGL
eukprot:CAMPEP_0171305750 /NCGR_PEP_ID=MMETSP0816-20121228/15596_1 /TAXON_ID=420281 /ORGANISM="Proboscia inermis, Strain CCAP1064/1" /LENGTH=90 /DNA_ID=CAMNT_0011786783 /DNA_START=560 /DNA_END=829 /DNA_ORIENTATION=-